ncbi:hypothetical protein [Serratia fonticola]
MTANYSEFKHENLTESEADFLVDSYKRRGIVAKKSASKAFANWEVSALLEEDHINQSSRIKSPNVWGNANVTRVSGRSIGDKNTGGSRT